MPRRITVVRSPKKKRITLWLMPIAIRERRQRFVIEETVSSSDKSPKHFEFRPRLGGQGQSAMEKPESERTFVVLEKPESVRTFVILEKSKSERTSNSLEDQKACGAATAEFHYGCLLTGAAIAVY
ncbi:hypothetical protein AVEN_234702-1 [Araneus ventricosus]|uniref:Uncharacterized protein n=1 Tax=Araneus ventricosus TaxID=182803 RepID=A0A4Y2WI88_ARAVE|nr:hypothetical protein AVEN_234702-1 [Araneus ventricosus]